MPDSTDAPNVTGLSNNNSEFMEQVAMPADKPKKTVNDWLRDLRMSASVNKTTLGVESERVTPELMLAASKKLLKINRREAESDPKDSLEFQRIYGPTDYFAEHVLRDAGRVGRQLLWKATNRGNLDFMAPGALDQHVSDVFNSSKLTNMVDGSSPLETVEASYKVTRLGEGGVGSVDSAPTEMRLVQPSFMGFIDPVRSVESLRVGLDAYLTKHCMKGSDGKLYNKFIDARTGKEVLLDSETAAKSVITTPDMMQAKTNHIYAVGGKTGARIVKKSDVDYYLPRMDEAFTNASNLVTGLSGVKELRLLMGCLHPLMNVICVNASREVSIIPARDINTDVAVAAAGCTDSGEARMYQVRTTVSKFPGGKNWFRKIVLYSGRTLITSKDHRWPVLVDGKVELVNAEKLKKGSKVLRSSFKDMPSRRMFINKLLVTRDVALLLGYAARTLALSDGKLVICYEPKHRLRLEKACAKLNILDDVKFYHTTNYRECMSLRSGWFVDWLKDNVGVKPVDRRVPPAILSSDIPTISCFLDAYTADETQIAMDSAECLWILNLPNTQVRDSVSFLLARIRTDTYYRDSYMGDGEYQLALKLVDMKTRFGDCIVDEVKSVLPAPNAAIMVDIDINDNLYATANGIITHNSKYPQQAVSIESREAPLVRGLDERSGKDMHSLIGKYLGARYAKKPGTVMAVRKDRIDMLYDDGTKGSVDLYENFPMNAKGYITNTPQVKAGMHLKEGDLLASSNYTDDKGVAALGTNLRTGWLSWKGGTYEDAIVLSESAAKKLTSTTMYSNDLDLDKTITLGKHNYMTWKPSEFTKDQLDILDSDGIVRPGTIVRRGDPLVLAVRTTEPSPGTMGKRILTDLSQTWEHEHPGRITDIVRTRKGVRVLATVTAPTEVGDKVSGCFDDKTEVFTTRGFVLFRDLTPVDKVAILHEDGTASFELPKAYQTDWYEGVMVEHRTRRTSMCVTPNHNVAYVPRYAYEQGDTRLTKSVASDVYKTRIFVRTSACFDGVLARPGEDTVTLPTFTGKCRKDMITPERMVNTFMRNDLAAFLGIYLAEGHCAKKQGQRWIRISQYANTVEGKQRCQEIAQLLDRMKLEWHYYGNQYFMISNWPIYNWVRALGNSYEKHIPEEVFATWSKQDMQQLLVWFYMGDGEKALTEDGAQRCATVSKRLADDLQRLYILTGKYSNVHSTVAQNAKGKRVYKVSSAYKSFMCYGLDKGSWSLPDYAGMIYCVTTSTGIILTRRDGIVSWNGQSYGNKGVISQIIPDDQMPKDKDGKPLEMLLSPLGLISRCYDDQTEFLTDTGWKLGRDVADTDLLCCYNTGTDDTEWLFQSEPMYRSRYRGDMYIVSNSVIDFAVTTRHKVWANVTGKYEETCVNDIYGKECFLPSTDHRTLCIYKGDWCKEWYDGMVYCPTVPTGYVVTRRNGKLPICLGNTNPQQLNEALLGKVAHRTGKPEVVPAFYNGNMHDYVADKLKQHRLSAEDDFFDPETGRRIPNVVNGYSYIYKLKHLAESKLSARGTDQYAMDDTPGGDSKRFGTLEVGALVSHNAFDNLLDAKLIRGQSNSDFWRSVRTGGVPTIPGEPLVQKKFFAHLQGSGVNVRKTPKGVSVFALSNNDVKDLAGPREVKSRDTYEARTFSPIDGGLFGQDVFGPNGDKWAYIQLDEPVPNPVMAEPLARLLRLSDKGFVAAVTGTREVDGMKGPVDVQKRLSQMDLTSEARTAMQEFKAATASKKDAALKRYVAIENMRRQGVPPDQYMLTRIPVLPPVFRPITSSNGLTMVADANYLYAQILDARDDMREAKSLPQEYQDKARANLYRKWNELVGLYDPEDIKLRNKNVGGLLQWALGKGSPKFSAFHRKVLGTSVDTVGRGTIVPDSKLTIDEIGIPVNMALGIMAPFVEHKLVNAGYSPIDAMKMVKKRDKRAFAVLDEVVKSHPVEMNRAPTLHKFNIMAFKPVLVQGNAIKVNPAVCPGFNADFDGDAVNIHVPVSDAARNEAMNRMRPSRNLIAPSNRKIMNKPEKEYMQGLYIATRMGKAPNGRAQIFRTYEEAREAYRQGAIDVDTPIQILQKGE